MTRRTALMIGLLCAALFGVLTSCEEDDRDDGSSDGDADGDTDTDSDTDTDTDTDGDTDSGPDCTSCHGNPPSTGSHFSHYGYSCATCHGAVVDSGGQIVDEDAHVDDTPDIDPGGGTYTGGSCADTGCHGTLPW